MYVCACTHSVQRVCVLCMCACVCTFIHDRTPQSTSSHYAMDNQFSLREGVELARLSEKEGELKTSYQEYTSYEVWRSQPFICHLICWGGERVWGLCYSILVARGGVKCGIIISKMAIAAVNYISFSKLKTYVLCITEKDTLGRIHHNTRRK